MALLDAAFVISTPDVVYQIPYFKPDALAQVEVELPFQGNKLWRADVEPGTPLYDIIPADGVLHRMPLNHPWITQNPSDIYFDSINNHPNQPSVRAWTQQKRNAHDASMGQPG